MIRRSIIATFVVCFFAIFLGAYMQWHMSESWLTYFNTILVIYVLVGVHKHEYCGTSQRDDDA